MLLTDVHAKALLDIFEHLDLIDSINLAATCNTLQTVGELHFHRYKVFNLINFLSDPKKQKRRNRIDAMTVLKRIGPFVSVLVADLYDDNLGESIRKYCNNVRSLKISRKSIIGSNSPFVEWAQKLKLEKLTISLNHLYELDLCETTILQELNIHQTCCSHGIREVLQKTLERNCHITSLRLVVMNDCDSDIKFKRLKHLGLKVYKMNFEKLADNLEMTHLEKVQMKFSLEQDSEAVHKFFKKLAESAPMLKDLSIDVERGEKRWLSALALFDLTSLRISIRGPIRDYIDLTKTQPNLKHLDTAFVSLLDHNCDDIIRSIKELDQLETYHIQMPESDEYYMMNRIRRIIEACSIHRPTLQLYIKYIDEIGEGELKQVEVNECENWRNLSAAK